MGGLRRLCGGLRRLCGLGCAGYVVDEMQNKAWLSQPGLQLPAGAEAGA